jgi:site-specific DNA recombinase
MQHQGQVVAYCRVSTLEQKRRGYGIDIQIRDVTLFAERGGLFVRRFYRDEARSGIAEDRVELQRLLRDCHRGKVGTVILPSLDRLSRDVRLAENLFYEFERAGIRVLIADMPTYNGKDRKDVLVRQIREAIAEENRKDVIERLLKGRLERVRRGLPPGGTAPYGYRRNGHGLVIDEDEAVIIRSIFERAGEGLLPGEIARGLKPWVRRNGKTWTRRQVAAVLSRGDLYRHGIVRYGGVEGKRNSLVLVHEESMEAREGDTADER